MTPTHLTRSEAELEKLKAEIKNQSALARKHGFDAQISALELEQAQEAHRESLATDWEARVFRYTDDITSESTQNCMETIAIWDRLDTTDIDYEVVFTSPGGEMLHGFGLIDFFKQQSRRGRKMILTDIGYVASMAGVILQAGDVRRIGSESWLHIHECSWSMPRGSKFSEHIDEVKFSEMLMNRVFKIYTDRSNGKISEERLREMVLRKEAWFSAEEALKYGFVDEIV